MKIKNCIESTGIEFAKNIFGLILGLTSFLLIAPACTSSKGGNATLTISIPQNSNVSLSSNAQFHAMFNDTLQSSLTSFSQLNCFFVFVSGPEANMSNNSCKLQSGTTIPVGVVAGAFPPGSTSDIAVPAGMNRTISIFGLETDSTVPCPTVNSFNSLESHFTNPVFVGSVNGVNLSVGETSSVNIPVTATLQSGNFLVSNNSCQGPAFNGNGGHTGGGGGGGPPATYGLFPQDNLSTFYQGSCVPMNLRILDANNGGANVTGKYEATLTASVLSGSGSILFYDFVDATCSSTPVTSVSFQSFNTRNIYVKMPSTAPVTFQIIAAPSSGPTTLATATSSTYSVTASYSTPLNLYMVDGRSFQTIKAGWTPPPPFVCYPYIQQVQDANGMPVPFNTPNTGNTGNFSSSGGMAFYGSSDMNCVSTSTGSMAATISSGNTNTNNSTNGILQTPGTSTTLAPFYNGSNSFGTPVTFTQSGGGPVTQFGIVGNNFYLNPVNGFTFTRPGSCQYVGEVGCFDSAGNRTSCGFISGDGFQVTNLTSGVLSTSGSCTGTPYDVTTNNTSILNPTVNRIPLYSTSTAVPGNYNISISVSGSNPRTTPFVLNVQ